MEMQEVKNVVNTARDLLVGKVPLPVDQCQEITRALIYKFLSASDATSVAMNGQPAYFTGELARCRWDALMRPEQTANDVDRLYREGMALLGRADVMPAIRTIYQDAYIPYNDPIILRDFLRAIDRFDTTDTEKIGDAYEMLLQDLGAQASAGQFRTPRHIIDFIVAIIDPQKHETILDPACGTGGFLASAWEHVNRADRLSAANRLSAADKGNLARNLVGYDISPTMEMLSTVNLFLHHRQQPSVSVYDTLTSEERWNDHYDVILANPPFMSPKGGIRPHGRFFSRSKRSEVLFVDYIMGHLNDSGRAGVIVPEGVIFQSQRAHTQLRRLLVETALVAVISLPGGVFQPYSGVKTSILILDKTLARHADGIAFFKVENDGYDLGAQRRPIAQNDLPAVADEINEYLRRLRAGETLDDFAPQTGLLATKERIAEDGEYNLSGERYHVADVGQSQWPIVKVGEVFERSTKTIMPGDRKGPVTYVGLENISQHTGHVVGNTVTEDPATIKSLKNEFERGDILYGKLRPNLNKVWLSDRAGICSTDIYVIKLKHDDIVPELYAHIFRSHQFNDAVVSQVKGAQLPRVSWSAISRLEIPLPPLEVQRELVAEIEGYQRVIDGARAVVDNWRPRIAVDPEWPMVKLEEACEINPETIVPTTTYPEGTIFYADISSVSNGDGRFLGYREIDSSEAPSRARRGIRHGDVLISTVRPNLKAFTMLKEVPERALASTGFAVLRARPDVAEPGVILASVHSDAAVRQMVSMMGKGSYPSINQSDVASIKVPLPPLETQRAIVSEIEAERALVSANRELMERMEQRIAGAIGRVWGG